ncbi:MAG: hypothetical protein ACFFCZ_03000 [Promethearchaeota archaeon]
MTVCPLDGIKNNPFKIKEITQHEEGGLGCPGCPICGSEDLEYGVSTDEKYSCRLTCKACGYAENYDP